MSGLYMLQVQDSDGNFASGVFETFEKALVHAKGLDDRLPDFCAIAADFIVEGPEADWTWNGDEVDGQLVESDHAYRIAYVEVGQLLWT